MYKKIFNGTSTIVKNVKISPFCIKDKLLLTEIELYLIEQVKHKRIENGMSQLELSQAIGYSDSFIAHVEAPSKRAKYNVNHLNAIAKILCCSPKDFWPKKPI